MFKISNTKEKFSKLNEWQLLMEPNNSLSSIATSLLGWIFKSNGILLWSFQIGTWTSDLSIHTYKEGENQCSCGLKELHFGDAGSPTFFWEQVLKAEGLFCSFHRSTEMVAFCFMNFALNPLKQVGALTHTVLCGILLKKSYLNWRDWLSFPLFNLCK